MSLKWDDPNFVILIVMVLVHRAGGTLVIPTSEIEAMCALGDDLSVDINDVARTVTFAIDWVTASGGDQRPGEEAATRH